MNRHLYHKSQRTPASKIAVLLIGLIVLILLGYAFINNFLLNQEIDQEIAQIGNSITTLEEQNIELQELIKYFDSSAYAEQKARAELSLKKEGENVVVITDENKDAEDNIDTLKKLVTTKDSNPKRWFTYFFIK